MGVKPKRRELIAPFQQFKLTLNHGALQTILYLLHGQIGSVDLFVPAGAAACHGFVIVFPCEQIQIPHLWFSGHKQVQSPRKKHFSVILAQGTREMLKLLFDAPRGNLLPCFDQRAGESQRYPNAKIECRKFCVQHGRFAVAERLEKGVSGSRCQRRSGMQSNFSK